LPPKIRSLGPTIEIIEICTVRATDRGSFL
jgi:hypothetical protein